MEDFYELPEECWPVSAVKPAGEEPLLALTFDDGPSFWTPQVLDVLAEHEAKATFFVVGARVESAGGVLRRMISEGHVIGNHTFNHLPLKGRRDETVIDSEITRTQEAIAGALGQEHRPRLLRLPAGRGDPFILERMAKVHGLRTMGWSVQSCDWHEAPSDDDVCARVLDGAEPGAVVLLHDGLCNPAVPRDAFRERTTRVLRRVLPELQGSGFKFVTLPDLLERARSPVFGYGNGVIPC